MAEKKGSPRIDNEDVLVMRKAGDVGAGGVAEAVVGSPPFGSSMVEGGDPNYAHKFHGHQDSYGTTPGQLGAMKPGHIEDVL